MYFKKNTFKIISPIIFLFVVSCTSKSIDIQGTTKFSTMKEKENSYLYHTVVFGDSLWSISAKYYNDPFIWPNIFKNNQNIIYDADLILPGQSLIMYKKISDGSRKKARDHAISRGLWVVGYREESDIIFLEND